MALVYRVNINLYSDNTYTTKIATIPNRFMGIVECIDNLPTTDEIVSDSTSLEYFWSYLKNLYDSNFMGSPYVHYTPWQSNVKPPETFLPLANEYEFSDAGYIEFEFSNGSTIRFTSYSLGQFPYLYDKNGALVDTVWSGTGGDDLSFFVNDANGFPWCGVLACDNINGDTLEGNLGVFMMTAGYNGQSWKQLLQTHYFTERNQTVLKNFFNGYVEPDAISDPYAPEGDSQPGGGGGTWGDLSDSIDFPSLPTLSAIGTGFVTLYIPTATQLSNLASYMWNGDAQTLDFWRKIVADPIDLILGLNIIPVALPSAGGKNVTVGGLSTDVYMTYTSTQYVEIDCGSLTVPEFYGAYLDYAPYTKFDLYLPYCGTHPLIADEIVGKTIHIKYHVDALSGACIAYVKCGDSVLYEFSGNVCAQIPVTANQFGDMVRSAISIASAIGTMVATDGATAPMAVGAIASAGTNSMGLKPTVEKSGAIGGMAGQLGIQKPYLIITRPSLCIPKNQNMFMGYPSFVTVLLNDLHGYNEISSIHIENVPATDTELSEIESLLKGGVIF